MGKRPIDRALMLLAAACPNSSSDALAGLSISQRDASLLELRICAFGSELDGLVICPRCGDRLEMNLDTSAMRSASTLVPVPEVALTIQGMELCLRPPTSDDLRAVADLEMDAMQKQLVERCLVEARYDNHAVSASQLPPEVLDGVMDGMADADPRLDPQVDIACPVCGHRWQEMFDIVSFFWTEIDAWARRVLSEVHTLAAAYGWKESDILALSPARRQLYLEMVGV